MSRALACQTCHGRSVLVSRVASHARLSRASQLPAAAVAQPGTAGAATATAGVDAAAFEDFLLTTQHQILREAEQLDGRGKTFITDRWERPGDNAGV